jgi:hypothetical protein
LSLTTPFVTGGVLVLTFLDIDVTAAAQLTGAADEADNGGEEQCWLW